MAYEAREKAWLETGPLLDQQLRPQAEHFAVRCRHDAETPAGRGPDTGAPRDCSATRSAPTKVACRKGRSSTVTAPRRLISRKRCPVTLVGWPGWVSNMIGSSDHGS
jgi:hypothetical protein